MIVAGFERAVRSGRGITGTLHVGFVGAAGGQLRSDAAELLHARWSVSVEDLAGVTVLRTPDDLPGSPPPRQIPAERSIDSGPAAGSFQESLTLVGAGRGVLPVGAHIRRYYMRPEVAYVLLRDAPPVHWRLMWRVDGATARVRAFAAAAHDLVRSVA